MCRIYKKIKKIKLFDLERADFEDRIFPGPGQRVLESEIWIEFSNDPEFQELVREIAAAYQAHHLSEEIPGRLPAAVRLLEPFMELHDEALNTAQHYLWLMAEDKHMRWVSFRHPVFGILVFFSYLARCRFWQNLMMLPDLLGSFRKKRMTA